MAILGKLVKSLISAKYVLTNNDVQPYEAQERQLKELLETAKNTSFGIYYGFDRILYSDDPVKEFRQSIPIFDYHTMDELWWSQQQKESNITWPGKPDFFALSSGTTGKKSKRIPVTQDLVQSMRRVGFSMIEHLSNYDLPESVFEKELLMLSSCADLDEHREGFMEGEISGINVSNFPGWYDTFYRPGKEIAEIDSWDERVERIAEEAPNWDIGAIAGIPSWVQMMLKAIIKRHNLKNIHEIWPDFSVYASGGVAFEPFRENFDKLMGKPVTYMDTYLASEGFISYTSNPKTMDMRMALEHGIYFEFIPFDKRGFDSNGNILENPEVFDFSKVKQGEEYALLISTVAGAWRYMIGDTIKFTDLSRQEMVITGRTKFFLNVVGSQLSEEKINRAIAELAKQTGVNVDEFGVAAVKVKGSDKYYHQWVLASNKKINEIEAAQIIDEFLQGYNKNYKVARAKALHGIVVSAVEKDQFYEWLASEKKKGGQIKTPKVMSSEKMERLLDFCNKPILEG